MANISIPNANEAGYWHFLYRTTDPLDGRWYGGKRSTKRHPLSDRYIGSGNWIRAHPTRERLERVIVGFYKDSAAVFAAEGAWITWNVVFDDPLCMNLRDGGEGVSSEAAFLRYADPVRKAKHCATLQRMHANPIHAASIVAAGAKRAVDPIWQKANAAHMVRMHADPIAQANAALARTKMWADPAHRKKIAIANRLAHATPEWKSAHAAGCRNCSTNVFVVINEVRMILKDAARLLGISYNAVKLRKRMGWPESRWFDPVQSRRVGISAVGVPNSNPNPRSCQERPLRTETIYNQISDF